MVRAAGPANKLEQTQDNMDGTCVPAIVILYLMMRVLFRSYVTALLVLPALLPAGRTLVVAAGTQPA